MGVAVGVVLGLSHYNVIVCVELRGSIPSLTGTVSQMTLKLCFIFGSLFDSVANHKSHGFSPTEVSNRPVTLNVLKKGPTLSGCAPISEKQIHMQLLLSLYRLIQLSAVNKV